MKILSLPEFLSSEEISIISFQTNYLKIEQKLDFWSPRMWVHESKLCTDVISTSYYHFSQDHSFSQDGCLWKQSRRPLRVPSAYLSQLCWPCFPPTSFSLCSLLLFLKSLLFKELQISSFSPHWPLLDCPAHPHPNPSLHHTIVCVRGLGIYYAHKFFG